MIVSNPPFVVSPETELLFRDSQILTYRGGVYDSHRCAVARTSGLRLEVAVDPEALQVLLRLDGSHTLRDIAQQVAGELGLDGTALVDKATAAAPELLRHGLIFPQETVDLSASPASSDRTKIRPAR